MRSFGIFNMRFRWALPTILCLFIGLPFVPNSLPRLVAWRSIAGCLATTDALSLWAGQASPNSTCDEHVQGAEFQALAAWSYGNQLPAAHFDRLTPPWRQQLFAWRNGEIPTPPLALFFLRLSAWSWSKNQFEQSLSFSHLAMTVNPSEAIADILINTLGFSPQDHIPLAHRVRLQIAQVLPTYVYNYQSWFDVLLDVRDWARAQEVCALIQQNLPAHAPLALICPVALVQTDAVAAEQLVPILQEWPNDPMVLRLNGLIALRQGRWVDAERSFASALRYETNATYMYRLYVWWGDSLQYLQREDDARKAYTLALRYTSMPIRLDQLLQRVKR